MSRVVVVVGAVLVHSILLCTVLCASTAHADTVANNVRQLETSSSYKVRLAAALALSKSRDPRAVIALSTALGTDADATVRRVSALALEKMIDARTPTDARELGLDALNQASTLDRDPKVRATAAAAFKALAALRRKRGSRGPGDRPPVFVNIDATIDQSKTLPRDASERVMRVVKTSVERTGYATSWPGGLPTSAELSSSQSRAFIVASTVKKVDIRRAGAQAQIKCTVAIRVAPWEGKDGGERWEANRAASASGSANATTGTRERDIESGVRDCVEAVAEDVTSRQVVPFLKRVAAAGS